MNKLHSLQTPAPCRVLRSNTLY